MKLVDDVSSESTRSNSPPPSTSPYSELSSAADVPMDEGHHISGNKHPILKDLIAHPRDGTRLLALFELLQAEASSVSKRSDLQKSCLLNYLEVSNQCTAVGMMGWLEYGTCPIRERAVEQPLFILRKLAQLFIGTDDLVSARDALQTLLLRAEEHLPMHHPIILTTLVDLAAIVDRQGDPEAADALISRASTILALFLSDSEDSLLEHIDTLVADDFANRPTIRPGSNAIPALWSFVEIYQNLMARDRSWAGPYYRATKHHFLAEALTLLAVCVRTAQVAFGTRGETEERLYWQRAALHYRAAIPCHNRTVVHGLARCLRELGHTKEAMTVLTEYLESAEAEYRDMDEEEVEEDEGQNESQLSTKLAFGTPDPPESHRAHLAVSMGHCFWLLSLLCLDAADDTGRMDALHCLMAASKILRPHDPAFRQFIEGAAQSILEPGDKLSASRGWKPTTL